MFLQLVYCYFVILFALIIYYFVGASIRYYFYKSAFKRNIPDVFINLLLGLVISITLYSVTLTYFKTINSFFIFFLSIIVYVNIKKKSTVVSQVTKKKEIKLLRLILLVLMVSLTFFIFYALQITNIYDGTFTNQTLNSDFNFYSKLSQYLTLGYENQNFANNFLFNSGITQPYHYFELWVNAFLFSIFKVPPLLSFSLLSTTLLSIIFYIGVLSLYKKENLMSIKILIIVLCLCFISFNYSRLLVKLFPILNNLVLDLRLVGITNTPKFIPISIFFVAYLFFHKRNEFLLSWICILSIPVVTSISAPAVFGGIIILLIYCFFKREKRYISALNIFTVISFILLYSYFVILNSEHDDVTINILDFNFKLFFINIKWLLLVFFYSYLPYFLLFIFSKRRIKISLIGNEYIVLYFGTLIIALIMAGISYNSFNSGQFFSNIAIPVTNILVIYFFLNNSFKKNNLFFKIVAPALIITCIVASFMGRIAKTKDISSQYKEFVVKEIKNQKYSFANKKIFLGYLQSKEFYQNKTPFQWAATSDMIGTDLGEFVLMYGNTILIGISDMMAFDIFKNEFTGKIRDWTLQNVSKGAFYRFVLNQKKENKFISVGQSQIDYIKKMEIKYLFIAKEADISKELMSQLKLICIDIKTRESFYKVIQ